MLLTILAVTAATTVYLEKTHSVGNYFKHSFLQNACACDTTTTESTTTTAVIDLVDHDTMEHDLLLLTAVETSSSSDSSG